MLSCVRTRSRVALVASLAASVLGAGRAIAQDGRNNPLVGANVGGLADWMRTHEFADLTKQARQFGPHPAPWLDPVPADSRGFPIIDGGSVFYTAQPANIGLGGVYRFQFVCEGDPLMRKYDSSGSLLSMTHDRATGLVQGEYFFPENGDKLILSWGSTKNGLRDFKFLRPGAHDGDLFNQQFVDLLLPFGVIRFMPWTKTNDSTISRWSQRTRVEDATYRAKSGVPYEICVQLCNLQHQDMWINVPHMADDAFVRELARLIRDNLDPSLNVYVEYSNEVWNYMFTQASWNLDRAIEEAEQPGSVLRYDGSQDIDTWRHRRYAKKTVEIGRIFAEEFGPGSLNTRVRPVLGAQFVAPWQHDKMLTFINDVYGPPGEHVWAMAVGPYFNARPEDDTAGQNIDTLLDAFQRNLNSLRDGYEYEHLATMTAWYGLKPFVAYEGAPDTSGANNQEAKRRASYEPRMRDICTQYLNDWFRAGGGAFLWFHAGAGSWINTNGSWSIIESYAEDSPKYEAIKLMQESGPPAVTAGVAYPGTVDARRHLERHGGWENLPHELMGPNDVRYYLVRAEEAGRYPIAVRATSFIPSSDIFIGVNGVEVGAITLQQRSEPGPQWFGPVYANLHAGLNAIRVRCTTNGYLFSLNEIGTGPFSACDSIDFNNDGSVFDPADIDSFLSVYSEGPCLPSGATCNDIDFNNDGGVFDPMDIDSFLSVYSEGPCL
ncbi:MAG: hypothetical protein U0640_04990 [Phycisphaerales bacterium]